MSSLAEHEQETLALEEAAFAVIRMLRRGVVRTHIPPSALVMMGLGFMEALVSRKSIGLWLAQLAETYGREVLH
jgi:hypothetical protein